MRSDAAARCIAAATPDPGAEDFLLYDGNQSHAQTEGTAPSLTSLRQAAAGPGPIAIAGMFDASDDDEVEDERDESDPNKVQPKKKGRPKLSPEQNAQRYQAALDNVRQKEEVRKARYKWTYVYISIIRMQV